MACVHVQIPGGGGAIVCGGRARRRTCSSCDQEGGYQCDWKTGKGTTCDAWVCASHAQEVGPDKHLCPAHQAAYKDWLARRASPSSPAGSTI